VGHSGFAVGYTLSIQSRRSFRSEFTGISWWMLVAHNLNQCPSKTILLQNVCQCASCFKELDSQPWAVMQWDSWFRDCLTNKGFWGFSQTKFSLNPPQAEIKLNLMGMIIIWHISVTVLFIFLGICMFYLAVVMKRQSIKQSYLDLQWNRSSGRASVVD